MEYSELTLVKQAQSGQKNAFGELYDQYYPKIFGYIVRRVGSAETGADITQETFVKILKNINSFVYQDIPFSAWVYRIATNEIANFYRQKNSYSLNHMQEKFGFDVEDETNIEQELMAVQEEIEKKETFKTVLTKLQELSLDYQEVISLRFFEKKKTREIADILCKNEGTVKSLLSRGIAKLKLEMGVRET